MADELEDEVIFGVPEEWTHFKKNYGSFLGRFPNLLNAIKIAFLRTAETGDPLDRFVFLTGRLCVEEFFEVFLLCGNGYGIAAQKIVRGMYERAVTVRYLKTHPEELENYFDYYWIAQHKLLKAIEETFGKDALPDDKVKETEENFQLHKDKFMVDDCKECGTRRLNHTWSKLDIVSMARVTGLGEIIVPAYYVPTQEAHASMKALLSRLDRDVSDSVEFAGGPQRDRAQLALITAHNLVLNILWLQSEHFQIPDLESALKSCGDDFLAVWKKE